MPHHNGINRLSVGGGARGVAGSGPMGGRGVSTNRQVGLCPAPDTVHGHPPPPRLVYMYVLPLSVCVLKVGVLGG